MEVVKGKLVALEIKRSDFELKVSDTTTEYVVVFLLNRPNLEAKELKVDQKMM